MLKSVSECIVERLIKKEIISRERKAVYLYGCELLFSTAFTVISILAISFLTGYFVQAVAFLLAFMPIRTVASGYHASSYRNCFLLTNLVAFFCMIAGRIGSEGIPAWLMWTVFTAAQCAIWFRGPFRSKIHPLKEELIERNRIHMHRMQVLEVLLAVLFMITDCRVILNTIILATIMVALMIYIAEKEEYKNAGNVSGAD
ncbi:MAG: accessory gene regulator B family protein [Lachnospiraceae bacterium]|nr:accessory gene regulator B family protein [Lachnospiraceae bacterium]